MTIRFERTSSSSKARRQATAELYAFARRARDTAREMRAADAAQRLRLREAIAALRDQYHDFGEVTDEQKLLNAAIALGRA